MFPNDPPNLDDSTLSLHDALPIFSQAATNVNNVAVLIGNGDGSFQIPILFSAPHGNIAAVTADRKSTRLNSSHRCISYAVFCLKKKKSINATDKRDYRGR